MDKYIHKENTNPLKVIIGIIVCLWIVHFISYPLPFIKTLGIYPRSIFGLIGIVTSPFLHDDMAHLISNTSALFVLGLVFLGTEKSRAGYIFIPIYFLSGLGTWIIGKGGANHIGASGVIYGIMGYLMTIGIFRKKIFTLIMSILIFLFYGATLWGMFPFFTQGNISWQAHLSGFIVGVFTARSEAKITRH